MKRKVDLTENRFFSRKNFFGDLAFGVLSTSYIEKSNYPWTAYLKEIRTEDDYDLEYQKKSLIALGDKKKRAEIKNLRQMDSLDYCDCCGSRMNLKPWDREIGICHKCNNYYEKDRDKCLWRKKEVIRNAIIRIA